MAVGYRTSDSIDFNEIWYGLISVVDQYQTVSLPFLESLAMRQGRQIMKYAISESNGFQRLGPGERPDRKLVTIATMYPFVEKFGYGVGTDLDTMRMGAARDIMLDIARPVKEDPEHVLIQMLKTMMLDPGTNNQRYGWWNGEFAPEELITAPPRFQQNAFSSGHTHYLTSVSPGAISLADFNAVKQTIKHHGYMGSIIAFINSREVQALEDLAAFTQSSIIRSGISDQVAISGLSGVFQMGGVTFHPTEMMPAGYMLFVEAGGMESDRPLIMFEPEGMSGLNLFPGPIQDYPLVESFYERWMGFKVWRRGAGVALQINTPDSPGVYDDPTFVELGV